jgi:pimeloyl-ACP methyl ester carboxylesterase
VRALALDRPGIGQSTFQAGRRVADWPRDVSSFADALELDRFAVLGWSGGGPYALACAAELRDRITATGVAAGVCPSDWPGALKALGADDRLLTHLALRAPWLGRALLAAVVASARRWPRGAMQVFLHPLPSAEREAVLRHTDPADPLRPFTEAFEQGARGPVGDYRVYGLPWGFAAEEIGTRVELWHGDADTVVGMTHAELLAERLPNATLQILPGSGHLFPLDRVGDLLAALV